MGGLAWVTLATNDSYSLGALVLAHSLKQVGTTKQLVVLVTPGVTNPMREKLSSVFDVVQEVNILDSKDETNLRLLKRPELGVTFTKLHCWRLTQFDKCVFLDADTLVLQNCDELFDREELSAAPDVGWPDCFNSGVFVYRPSNETYEKLVQFALEKGSFDGGDQGLLNLYFSDWSTKDISKHLPFIYNLCSTACYSYLPAFKQFGADAKVIHFIGASKPWLQYFNTETRKVQPSGDLKHLEGVLQHWWNIFCNLIHPKLSPEMARSSSDVTHTSMSSHIPENHYKPPPVSTKNEIWDPWEEYDQRQSSVPPRQIHEPSQEKPFESHNTNARNIASDQNIPFPVIEQPNRPESPPHHQNVPPMASAAVSERPHSFQSFNVNPTIEQPHSFPSFAVNPTVEQHHPLPSSVVKPTAKQHHSFPSFAAVDPAVITPPKVNDHHIPQESLTAVDFSQSSTVQPVFIEFVPKPNEPIHPSVPPSECEAAVTVCKETTLHTPPREDEADSGLAGAFAQLTLGAPRTAEQSALDDHLRRQGWEVGNIDYLGRDSFDNIWSKICETLSAGAPAPAPKAKESTPPSTDAKPTETSVIEATVAQEIPPSTVAIAPQETKTDTSVTPTETPKPQVPQSTVPEQPKETPSSEIQPQTPAEAPAESAKETASAPKAEAPPAEPLQCSLPAKEPEKPKETLETETPKLTSEVPISAQTVVTDQTTAAPTVPQEPPAPVSAPPQESPAPAQVPSQETPAPTSVPPQEPSPPTPVPTQEPSSPAPAPPKPAEPAQVPPQELAAPAQEPTAPATVPPQEPSAPASVPQEPSAPAPAPQEPSAPAPAPSEPSAPASAPPEPSAPVSAPTEETPAPPQAAEVPASPTVPQAAATPVQETPAPPSQISTLPQAPAESAPQKTPAPPQEASAPAPQETSPPPVATEPLQTPIAPPQQTPTAEPTKETPPPSEATPTPQAAEPAPAVPPQETPAPPQTTTAAQETPASVASAVPQTPTIPPEQISKETPVTKPLPTGSSQVAETPKPAAPSAPQETQKPADAPSSPQPAAAAEKPQAPAVPPSPQQASSAAEAPKSKSGKEGTEQSKPSEAKQSAGSATSPTPPPRKGTTGGKKSKSKK